jgi:hypothetical protein
VQNDEAQKALSLANVACRVRAPVLAPLGYLTMYYWACRLVRSRLCSRMEQVSGTRKAAGPHRFEEGSATPAFVPSPNIIVRLTSPPSYTRQSTSHNVATQMPESHSHPRNQLTA